MSEFEGKTDVEPKVLDKGEDNEDDGDNEPVPVGLILRNRNYI